jgi:hypothetical protein
MQARRAHDDAVLHADDLHSFAVEHKAGSNCISNGALARLDWSCCSDPVLTLDRSTQIRTAERPQIGFVERPSSGTPHVSCPE